MTGQRFDFQAYPAGMKGGLTYLPGPTGVINGLVVSNVSNAGGNLTFNVSAGQARLDGTMVALPSNLTGVVLPVGGDLTTGTYNFSIYLNPRRLVRALTAAPANPAANDIYIRVFDMGAHQLVDDAFIYQNGIWTKYDMATSPPGYGHNNLPLNGIVPTVDTALLSNLNFALTSEKTVYHKRQFPMYVAAQAHAYLRRPCSLLLANVGIANNVVTVATYGDNALLPL